MSSLTPEDAPLTSQGQPRGVRSARQRGGSRSPPEDADAEPSSLTDVSGGSPPGGNARRMRHVAKQFLGTYYRDLNDAPERVTRHYTEDSVLTIEDASTPRATTPDAGAGRGGGARRGDHPRDDDKNTAVRDSPRSPGGFVEIVDFFEGIEPGHTSNASPMQHRTTSDPSAEGVVAIAARQREMFRGRHASVVSVDVRPVPSTDGGSHSHSKRPEGTSSSMTKEGERMMAVVLGNLHPTPGSDKGARDVQFMHTFVLEHKAGDASSNGDSFEDSEFSIVDEVFRRVDPVGDSRAPGGLAAGAASLLRAAQSPPPTRLRSKGAGSSRDGDSPPANDSEDEMNSSLEPEDGGDSPESLRRTPDQTLDDSVEVEGDVWLTNPMYGEIHGTTESTRDSNPGPKCSEGETPRAVRRAPGSAEVVPESPAINFASPNPFEDETEKVKASKELPVSAAVHRSLVGKSRRPMSPDAGSIPLPSPGLLLAQGGVQGGNQPPGNQNQIGGRPGSGSESRLNRVSRRYSHEFEDAGTRRTLFDESPYANRGRPRRFGDGTHGDDDLDDEEEEDENETAERRARRKERAAGGPPSSRHRRRVYSSASSSPAMSHAGILSVQPSPGAGIEPGTSGLPGDELNRGTGSSVAASPVAKRGLNARFQGDPTRADPNTSEGPGAESNRGPRGYEPMARSPQLVTLTERSDEGSAAASMRESVSVSESAINSDSERGSTRNGSVGGSNPGRGERGTNGANVGSDDDGTGSLRGYPVAEEAEILDWEDVRGYRVNRHQRAGYEPSPSDSPDPGPRSRRTNGGGYRGDDRGSYERRSHSARGSRDPNRNATRYSYDDYGNPIRDGGNYGGVRRSSSSAGGIRTGTDGTRTGTGGPPPVQYRGGYDRYGDGGYVGIGGYSQPGSRSNSRGSNRGVRTSNRGVSRSVAYERSGTYADNRGSFAGSIPRRAAAGSAPPSPSMGATRAREFGVRSNRERTRLSSAGANYRRDDYDFDRRFEQFTPYGGVHTPQSIEEEPPQLEDAVNYLGMLTAALHFTAAVVVFGFLLIAVYANGKSLHRLVSQLDRIDGVLENGGAPGRAPSPANGGGWGMKVQGGPKVGASVFGGSMVDVSGDMKPGSGIGSGSGDGMGSMESARRVAPKIVDLDSDEL